MTIDEMGGTIIQLRLVVEAEDFESAVSFYRDVLGLPEELYVESEGDARVMILGAGDGGGHLYGQRPEPGYGHALESRQHLLSSEVVSAYSTAGGAGAKRRISRIAVATLAMALVATACRTTSTEPGRLV